MTRETPVPETLNESSPTFVRHGILSVLTMMSILLYLDRFAVSIASKYIRDDLSMTETQMAWFISAFFWSYALCQVPAGWLSDRFGGRVMLTAFIVAWSVFTGLIGVVHSVWLVLCLRLFCGAAQAGAYPTSAGLIRQWYSVSYRGTASSIVGLGGRFGAVLAPILTARLIIYFVPEPIGPGWRQTMILYGAMGLFVAIAFAVVTRNSPTCHPWCNPGEQRLIRDEATLEASRLEPGNPAFPWRAFLTSISLWGNSLTQFFTNIGWVFVVTSLPDYLDKVHGVSLVTKGNMTAFPSGIGILGLLAGGRATDWAIRRFGLKRGRLFPLAASRFTAAGGYAMCLLLSANFTPGPDNVWLPWLYIVCLSIASMSTDFGSPAIWSYAQDVGGKYTASILGWGNMWGNLGAAVAPLIYNRLLGETPTIADWNSVFGLCCGVFVLSGLCAMLLDATKPLTVQSQA